MGRTLTILHTNDLHGRLNGDHARHLRALRAEADLFFDCGDCVKTGNLGIPLREELCWALLAEAGCDAAVIGNRESHVLESAFRAKIAGARHPLLCANLRSRAGDRPLPASTIIEAAGLRVGVVGVMVPMVTERMATRPASAYLWDPPIPAALAEARRLRAVCDVLIALTHIGHAQDLRLAEAGDDFDLILGGHSHTVVSSPVRVGRAWVCQAGSHGRFVGRYRWSPDGTTGELIPLGEG